MSLDNTLGFNVQQKIDTIEDYKFEPIKGYPMLHWKGKRPFTSTQFYPAQLKETHGEEVNGWLNKIFWGDNLQVMSHLLREYRGQVKLIYIDPPYDSRADYKKKIEIKGKGAIGNFSAFEEKQYTDIWANDEYLQFIYERIMLMRELLSDDGSIYFQCDPTRGHYIKIILDEIFGSSNFVNQVIWKRTFSHGDSGQGAKHFGRLHDMILFYKKSESTKINAVYTPYSEKYISDFYKYVDETTGKKYRLVSLLGPGGAAKGNPYYEFLGVSRYWVHSKEKMQKLYDEGIIIQSRPGTVPQKKRFIDESPGVPLQDLWFDVNAVQGTSLENQKYPTQKPEKLLERILQSSSNEGDLIFDCFMGSGTTQAVAMKLGRRFIGADINLGAIQTTTKRLLNVAKELNSTFQEETKYTGFQVYNVNNYDVFRNPVQAKELLVKALEIQPLPNNSLYDGEKDGRMVKIMPVNRIATRADLNELITNFDYKKFEKLNEENPKKPVEHILLVCMGHEPSLAAELKSSVPYTLDVEVVDILRDKANLEFKRDAEAEVVIEGGKLLIREFYPMNLLQKLSLQKENVNNWKELTDSVMIDFNYDGAVFEPQIVDVPEKNELVKGVYDIPTNAGTIHVKITDLLSESLELTVNL
ncbi:site-specific DNA-methyltransferase [Cloacibacterium sp.]|uniref:site-specific DNA-methyltransferase n=1 Tax=Cloacibacterium sp. TaxID=1913682 RepID=UPI0039E33F34